MAVAAEFLLALLAITAAFGGWILAYKMWKRDPDAVRMAAKELVQTRESLEKLINDLKTDLLLGPLCSDDKALQTLGVETVIQDAFERILQRTERQS